MKSQLIAIVAAVLMVGCCTPAAEPPPAKAPDISIHDAAREGNIEAVKQHLAAGTKVDAVMVLTVGLLCLERFVKVTRKSLNY